MTEHTGGGSLRVKVKAQSGHGGDGRVNRPPFRGEGMADQRREQMLQAALEVIVERGYADTRIADVTGRAGASPALVICYFKTKDQLLIRRGRRRAVCGYAVHPAGRVRSADRAGGSAGNPGPRVRVVGAVRVRRARIPPEPAARPQLSRS